MRKIETKMVNAIKDGRDMISGNTEVRVMWANSPCAGGTATHCCHVMLHGNNIATVYTFINGDDVTLFAVPNLLTLNEYPTTTTKSRLRALGVHVYTLKGRTFVMVPAWDNESGFRTYWIAGVDEKGESGIKVGAGQRAYHRALCDWQFFCANSHERDRRKAQLSPLLNLAQDLVINSDLVKGEQE